MGVVSRQLGVPIGRGGVGTGRPQRRASDVGARLRCRGQSDHVGAGVGSPYLLPAAPERRRESVPSRIPAQLRHVLLHLSTTELGTSIQEELHARVRHYGGVTAHPDCNHIFVVIIIIIIFIFLPTSTKPRA